MGVSIYIKRALNRLGYDLKKYNLVSSHLARRMQLLKHHRVDVLFDVGANVGQYAAQMREIGYLGRMVSFEPLPEAYQALTTRAKHDATWEAVNLALGDVDTTATINVAGNSQSSSLLAMLPRHAAFAPDSAYVDEVEVTVRQLDGIYKDYYRLGEQVYLKLDVQGYEQNVLKGASLFLQHVVGVQMEMSLVALYEGERLIDEMIRYMDAEGFKLMSIEPGVCDPQSGQMLQADGVFFRTEA